MKTTLFWFRKGLRLHDNVALAAALEGTSKLYPVFCLDPWFVASGSVGSNRMHFLLQSLADLDSSLRALDSRLIVLRGNPKDALPSAMRTWGIDVRETAFAPESAQHRLSFVWVSILAILVAAPRIRD